MSTADELRPWLEVRAEMDARTTEDHAQRLEAARKRIDDLRAERNGRAKKAAAALKDATFTTAHQLRIDTIRRGPHHDNHYRAVCVTPGCLYATPPADIDTAKDAKAAHVRATGVAG